MNPRPNGPSALHDGQTKWSKYRELRILDGTWKPFVPVQPVRDRIAQLRDQGMSVRSIAHAAGLPLSTITPIAWEFSNGRSPRKVRPEVAAAVLAVTPAIDNLPDGAHVPAVGTVRRIRALQALGWPIDMLAADLDAHVQALSRLCQKSQTVTVARARAVSDLYDRLSMTPGPSDISRRRAAARGWLPPLAWDDAEIDTPESNPNEPNQGRRGPRSSYSTDEARDLLAKGWNLKEIAFRFNVQPDSLARRLKRNERRGEAA
jgi:lambda repressor-like predicted transcriptional regulator